MKVKASLCIFASLILTITEAALPGEWPPLDQPPPPVAEWTALVDQTKVANAPVSVVTPDVGPKCPAQDTFCKWSCSGCTKPDTDVIECPTQNDWGLTFDDGPSQFTDTLLDFLATTQTKVTFFVVGSRVTQNPQILQKAVNAGHQIGVHTWSHPYLTSQSTEQIIAELKWTEAAIKAAVGLTPKYMRPPFGDFDDRVRDIASQLGYKIVVWDKDTNDWRSASDKTFQLTWIEGNFTEWVKEPSTTGHISLEHDLYEQTAARAQLTVPIVQGAGFTIKPVSVCVGDAKPYVEDVTLDAPPAPADPALPPALPPASPPAPTGPTTVTVPLASAAPATTVVTATVPPAPVAANPAPADASGSSGSNSAASLNSINLLSFVSFIFGSFMFI